MTNNELKKLSRADLLEMLIDQSTELEAMRKKLASAEAALQKRQIAIDQAGSIAEASLLLNGVFEAAERACQQYTDNIRQLSERQEAVCLQMENESRRKADQYQADVERRCAKLEAETNARCAEMLSSAKAASQKYWDDVSAKLEAFYSEHAGLRELLSVVTPPKA